MDGVQVTCPIDGSIEFKNVYATSLNNRDFSVVACTKCGLQMVNPQPTPEVLSGYYNDQYYGKATVKFIPIIQWLRRVSVIKKIRKISSFYAHQTGKIIDIGCADGTFLFNIKKRQWDTAGLEISENFRVSQNLNDLNIVIGDIAAQHFPKKSYNVVTLWHVFEHLAEPIKYLEEIKNIIAPNGLLVLTMPNIQSWQAHWFGRYWFHRDVPRHLFHYTPKTLNKLLTKYGFRIQKIEYFSLEYNPFGFIQSFYNRFLDDDNRFYDHLKNIKREPQAGGTLRFIFCLILLPICTLPAIALSIIEASVKRGGTMKVYTREIA